MRTESTQHDSGRENGSVSVRRTVSSTLSNSNILESISQNQTTSTPVKSKSNALSTSSVINLSRTKMIQRIFVSCTVFVVITIQYGNVTMIKNVSRNTGVNYDIDHNNYLAEKLDMIVTIDDAQKEKATTLRKVAQQLPTTSFTSSGKTETSATSMVTFVRQEMERLRSSGINPCSINSDAWLNSTRYGNMNHNDDDTYLTHDLVQRMILNLPNALALPDNGNDADESTGNSVMPTILKQTICHKESRFLQSNNDLITKLNKKETSSSSSSSSSKYDPRTIRLWAVKLIYLGMHYHQHRLAVPEAVVRYSENSSTCPSSPQQLQQAYDVGIFDYECPDAKYIVMPLGGNGLGSNVRGGMVVGLLIGLITDRIVLFVNNVKGANYNMNKIWSLASCQRKDYQCFFWPTSPCTVTHDDIKNAYALTRDDYRKVIKGNDQLKHIQEHKVWAFNTPFMPVVNLPTHAAETLYQHATTLIAAVSKEKHPEYHTMLMEAAETIRVPDDSRPGYNYAAANTKVQHALAFYAMRPNPRNAHQLDLIMNDIIPATFPPETSIGLPIRASDKCTFESECLSFKQHMQVTSTLWQNHIDNGNKKLLAIDPTVVFTTESTSVVKEQQAFITERGTEKFPFKFDFVTNTKDVTPDSGFMKDIVYNKDVSSDADSIMLSAMSSLKAQLLPRITIGNCCSNFHTMLNDFLSEGCGAASDNKFLCLQEFEDPRLRVCCGWHKKCIQEKKNLINATMQ